MSANHHEETPPLETIISGTLKLSYSPENAYVVAGPFEWPKGEYFKVRIPLSDLPNELASALDLIEIGVSVDDLGAIGKFEVGSSPLSR